MGFQLFHNVHYGQDPIVYECMENVSREGGDLRNRGFSILHNTIQLHNLSKCLNLSSIKAMAKTNIYPSLTGNKTCILMMLTNLNEPDWLQVSCTERLLHLVMCVKTSAENMISYEVNTNRECPHKSFATADSCFFVLLHHNKTHQKRRCRTANISAATGFSVILSHAVSSVLPPLFIHQDSNSRKQHKITFLHIPNLHRVKTKIVPESEAPGWMILHTNQRKRNTTENIVHSCMAGGAISVLFICDEKTDCPSDSSDEEHCTCKEGSTSNLCKTITASGHRSRCSKYYYLTPANTCQKYFGSETKAVSDASDENSSFTCSNGKQVNRILLNDLVPDCGREAEDESHLIALLMQDEVFSCETQFEVPCRDGHSQCYNIIDVCKYQLNAFSHIVSCRTGQHLQNCTHFHCNMMFKCANSYCVPWRYVCDAKWDCPNGDDSLICDKKLSCGGMFKCMNTQTCIHVGNVCDEAVDCPLGEDELFCELRSARCPPHSDCQCLLFAVLCKNTKLNLITTAFPHISVIIFGSGINSILVLLNSFQRAQNIVLRNNSLREICFGEHNFPQQLLKLDLGFNMLESLKEYCFSSLAYLSSLLINNNLISEIKRDAFHNLTQIKFLDISNNPLGDLPRHFLTISGNLSLFSILGITFTEIHPRSLQDTSVRFLFGHDFHVCCVTPSGSICIANYSWYSSCDHLLPKPAMKVLCIIVTVLIFMVNISSIVVHKFTHQLKRSFLIVLFSCHLNEEMLCLYLCVVCIADKYFEDTFAVKEHIWRSSATCFGAFAVLLFHTVSTQCLNVLSTVCRLMVVKYPLDSMFKRTKTVVRCLSLILLISLLVSIILTLATKFAQHQLPTSLCVPFADPSDSVVIILVLTLIISATKFFVVVTITAMHIMLVQTVLESGKDVTKSNAKSSNTTLFVQLICLSSSFAMCWLPANIIFLCAIFLGTYSTDLLIWTVIVISPLNSLCNPCIFMAASIRKHFSQQVPNAASVLPPKEPIGHRRAPINM